METSNKEESYNKGKQDSEGQGVPLHIEVQDSVNSTFEQLREISVGQYINQEKEIPEKPPNAELEAGKMMEDGDTALSANKNGNMNAEKRWAIKKKWQYQQGIKEA